MVLSPPRATFYDHDLNWVFSPRGGFAYAPGDDNKWLVHGGIGLFHDYFTQATLKTA